MEGGDGLARWRDVAVGHRCAVVPDVHEWHVHHTLHATRYTLHLGPGGQGARGEHDDDDGDDDDAGHLLLALRLLFHLLPSPYPLSTPPLAHCPPPHRRVPPPPPSPYP
eukprot:4588158-Pyramimonas_sp.AAC.1